MRFPYKAVPGPWGRTVHHAVLNVQIALPQKNAPRSKRLEAIIDSGASICTFHAEIGKAIGLDIETGEMHEPFNADGGRGRNYLHEIQIYLPGGPITTKASFSASLPCYALLGMIGFFEHFNVTFDATGHQVHLQRLYPA